jgi:hypothetical protein
MRSLAKLIVSTIIVTSLHGVGLVSAQSFVPVSNPKIDLALDTMNGHFSYWRTSNLGDLNALRATLSVTRLGNDPKWAPVFSIRVNIGGGDFLAFHIGTEARKLPLLLRVLSHRNGKTEYPAKFAKTLRIDEKLDVEMSWSAGKLIIRVGNAETKEMPISGPVTGLQISASTGELLVDGLVLGTIRR